MDKKFYSANFPLKRFRNFFVNACKVLEINPEPFPSLLFLVFLIIEPV